MARLPLLQSLKEALSVAAAGGERGSDTGELRASGTTRREFVKRSGIVGAGALAIGGGLAPLASGARARQNDDVRVVVGAGLAGLTAAYRLKRRGVRATVIEGNTRIGGRCWSGRGLFDDGQIIEHGGELIDTGHREIGRLARDLRLHLDDVLHADSTAAGYPTLYTSFTPAGQALDALSVRGWIDSRVPGGVGSKLGQLLGIAYNIEYGAETTDQSSLNLIYLLSGSLNTELSIFGASDKHFKVRGGNDLIVQRLGDEFDGQIRTGAKLTAIKLNGDGSYTLTVQGVPGGRLVAGHVVLAIPFSILRSQVDTSQAGFNAVKTTAIQQLGMGSNTKLHLQFKKRSWYRSDCNGEAYSDTGFQTMWEATRAQDGEQGILVNYTGGATASALDAWLGNAWSLGAYSYWKVRQYTAFAGAEGERSGNCHFAGEHTSIDYQGYLNGAVDTGIIAAKEILADLRLATAE